MLSSPVPSGDRRDCHGFPALFAGNSLAVPSVPGPPCGISPTFVVRPKQLRQKTHALPVLTHSVAELYYEFEIHIAVSCIPANGLHQTKDLRMSAIAINPVHRVVRFYEAPIGKKAIMAVTGVILFGYVAAHLLGNLQIYGDPEQINKYAAFLHNPSSAGLLWVARSALLVAVGLHILASLQLWKLKNDARPVAYVKKEIGRA